MAESAKANRIETNSTCRTSPSANAPMALDGTMSSRNSPKLACRAAAPPEATHVRARRPDVDENKGNDKRQRRDDLEIDQRLDRDATDTLCLAHTGDAVDH